MAKRKTKTRTHVKQLDEAAAGVPKSMVLTLGSSLKNHSLMQLVRDFRRAMQPHTTIRLRERKANKLKDFVVMTGPLGVTDLFVFKQSSLTGNISLRIGKMPKGPSLHFQVHSYSLMKDIKSMLKRPRSIGKDSGAFHEPPLLVMNGFTRVSEAENHEKLMITVFQNMFPAINPHATKLTTIKRVLLVSKTPLGLIEIRHYAISTKLVEELRNVRKLLASHLEKRKLPVMTNHSDIADLVLDPYSVGGLTSDSEVEDDAVVEIQAEERKRVNAEPETSASSAPTAPTTRKRAIKLVELGPRISMSLLKIEESVLGSSKTLYHAHITKTKEEEAALEKRAREKDALRAQRRAEQKKNVDAKQKKKDDKKERRALRKAGGEAAENNESDGSGASMDEDEIEINPSDYENDSELFSD